MLTSTKQPKHIVVLVSGNGTNLQALIDASHHGKLKGGSIGCVIASDPQAAALTRADRAAIPAVVIDPRTFDSNEAYTDALLARLRREAPDLIVLAGFLRILDRRITDAYQHKIINVHPSLLPAFSGKGCYGLRVHEQVLAAGVTETGATVHFVNEIPDAGAVILQKSVPVLPGDTPLTLQRRVMEQAEWVILPKAVRLFCTDRLRLNGNSVEVLP